jgi:uncharacterized protein (TIGR02246 family)
MKRFVILMLLVCARLGSAQEARDMRTVREIWQGFEAAYNAGDAATIAAFFSPDADRINASNVRTRGRAAIEKDYAEMLAKRAAIPNVQPFKPKISIRFVKPEVALIDGEWTGEQNGKSTGGRFVLVAIKNAGRWQLDAARAWDLP